MKPTASVARATDPEPARYPRATIRLRYGRKTLRHGLALGWRTEYPATFPVTVTRADEQAADGSAATAT